MGQIVDVDAPDPIVAPTSDGEHREVPQQPGDVVDQHPVATEEDRRAQHGVRQPALGQGPSTNALPRKYGHGRAALGWVMLTWTMRCTPARLAAWNKAREVGDRQIMIDAPMGESHPVRVVERRRPFE